MSDPRLDALPQGAVIGILGGGQLGRMLSVAAARLGYRCHIYEPSPNAPAGQVAERLTTAGYDDLEALQRFAEGVDVVTYEFENVPARSLDAIERIVPIRPGRRALAISQERLTEKDFLSGLGLQTAPYRAVDDAAGLAGALADLGPGILKTRRLGYDGKGQMRLSGTEDPAKVLSEFGEAPAILEGLVEFSAEISVIGARGLDGAVACYEPGRNVHRNGILATTRVPAGISPALRSDAVLIAARIMGALDHVGVMGVELFVTRSGLVVNEIAPRVHNSGHWTQAGCTVDQFEQHVRAIAGLPLGDGSRHADVEMTNLIGDDVSDLVHWLTDPACSVNLYGKAEARPGRKMGHVNRVLTPRH